MERTIGWRAPAHLRIAALAATVWNAVGAFDYLMTQTANDAYLATFTAEERAWFDAFPTWVDTSWALGVWGGLLGSLLLLVRSRFAVTAFLVSLAGMFGSLGYQLTAAEVPPSLAEGPSALMPYAVIGIGIALLLYAQAMRAKLLLH